MANPTTGLRAMPRLTFEEVKPEADRESQLLSLSDRVRKGELFLVLDIPSEALHPRTTPSRNRSTITAIRPDWINRFSRCPAPSTMACGACVWRNWASIRAEFQEFCEMSR